MTENQQPAVDKGCVLGLEPAPPEEVNDKVRERLIDRYCDTSRSEANSLVSNLIVVTSDLLQVQSLLRKAIDTALGDRPVTLVELETVLPGLDLMSKNAKQIERFSKLQIDVKEADKT